MKRVNPPIICRAQRDPTRRWVLWVVGIFLLLALVAGWIQTLYQFKPNAEAILADQEALQDRLDAMDEELTRISEAVEAWPGITEIPDEPIGPLADPTAWQTEEVTP